MLKPALALLLCLPLMASAAVYRWTDADGIVHFASSPPASGKYTKINPHLPPPTSAPGITGITQLSKGTAEAQEKQNKVANDRLEAEAHREARCAQARQRIAELENATARRLYTTEADGSRARMTQPEFDKRLDAVKAVARDNCDG